MKVRIWFISLFIAAFIAFLSSCSPENGMETIRVVFLPYFSNAPFFIAQEEGFFEEQGLTIELAEINRSSEAIPALENGEVDVVGGALSAGVLNSIYRGAHIKFVADKGHIPTTGCGSTTLIAINSFLKQHPSKNPSELRGTRIGFNPAGFTGYIVDTYLGHGGLSIEDIDVFNGKESEQIPLFQEGTLDIMVASEPWVSRVLQADLGEIWVSDVDVVPGSCFALVWYGPNLIKQGSDLGNRFMVAYLKGVHQFNQGKTERNVEILMKHTGIEEELIRAACWVSINGDGRIDLSGLDEFQAWALKKQLIDNTLSHDQVWDPRFIEYAVKELEMGE